MHAVFVKQQSTRGREELGAEQRRRRPDESHPCGKQEVALGLEAVGADGGVREQPVERLGDQEEREDQMRADHLLGATANFGATRKRSTCGSYSDRVCLPPPFSLPFERRASRSVR